MEKARHAGTFSSFELTCFIYGGESVVIERRAALGRIENLLGAHDTSKLPHPYGNTNREEAFLEGLRWGKAAFEDGMKHNHDFFDFLTPRYTLSNASPFGMTKAMFEPTLRFCASAEQQSRWLPLSSSGKIIGAYAQTELGHGSFVRGIETTATYDRETDEFVINSATLTSIKFWPGALGFSCTHAIVVARLITNSQDHGPHHFMVQLRSLEDGTPLPGISLGDVGLKLSYNETCNGFASFDHVRIPRTEMLMGYAKVARNGSYERRGHPQLLYSTMLMARGAITKVATFQLAQAVTIATRYSVVREQGPGPDTLSSFETSVMWYKSQHFRIFTLIAKSYAMLFASRTCDTQYEKLREQQDKGNDMFLPYTHSLTAGLKAWSTQIASDGAEDARKCCGGHGYLMIAGLGEIVATVTVLATLEGENYVMWQQVSRYLFKCLDYLAQGKSIDPQMAYLRDGNQQFSSSGRPLSRMSSITLGATSEADFADSNIQLAIYRHRAVRLALAAYTAVKSSKESPANVWNENMMSIIDAARAHIEYIVLRSFIDQIHNLPPSISPPVKLVLTRLCSLFALSNIINPGTIGAISFVEDGYLSSDQLQTIRSLVNDLLKQLIPDAIALTDAWDFTDASLCSALGMKDGNVYENIMNWVNQLPINVRARAENKGVFQPGWRDWIDPFLKARL
ncbi:acyl-CoA oxidase [Lojkania enalia]|uniref:Acyl-coenzyme A oxidase n=1 Tax=Lojkania enalia TaxID=147567 RepID=A0A9P4K153_9PLEO|nr:acyl-CoA oxidase [Didymosphaeria enalia]